MSGTDVAESAKKNKTPRDLYEEWRRADNKQSLRTAILRMGWKGDQKPIEGRDNAHWADVEWVARGVERMPGPKPSWEYLREIAEVVRGEGRENFRPLMPGRNQKPDGIERSTAQISMNGGEVRGHARAKVRHQAEWLVASKNELPAGLVRVLGDMLHNVTDADTGKPMIDRRQLAGAGSEFVPPRADRNADPSDRELANIIQGLERLEVSRTPDEQHVAAQAAVTRDLRFNNDGSVNRRSAAVRRGDVLVTNDGDIDGRSAMMRQATASSSSSSASTAQPQIPGLRYNNDNTVDRRSAAVRSGAVLVTNSGRVDQRSSAVRSAPVGPVTSTGAPDMRFAVNKAAYGGSKGGRGSKGGGKSRK